MAIRKGCFAILLGFVSWSSWSAGASSQADVDPPTQNAVDELMGITFDTGLGEDSAGASSIGGRFTRLHVFPSPTAPAGGWFGYGADVRAITLGFDSLDAGLVQLVLRAGFGTHAGVGFELEGAVGAATDGTFVPTYALGALLAPSPFFGVGVSTQEPISVARPDWLETTQLSVRVTLPLEPCRSVFVTCPSGEQRKPRPSSPRP